MARSESWGTPWKELSRRRRPRGRTRSCWRVRDRKSRVTGRRSSTGRWGPEAPTQKTAHMILRINNNDTLSLFRFILYSLSCSLRKQRSMKWRPNCSLQTKTRRPHLFTYTGPSSDTKTSKTNVFCVFSFEREGFYVGSNDTTTALISCISSLILICLYLF